jgi:hypothetical protein
VAIYNLSQDIPYKEYDGKLCIMIPHNLTFLHLAVVDRPKDPRCMVVEISEPKNWSLDGLSKEDRARKLKYNLPFNCYQHKLRAQAVNTYRFSDQSYRRLYFNKPDFKLE